MLSKNIADEITNNINNISAHNTNNEIANHIANILANNLINEIADHIPDEKANNIVNMESAENSKRCPTYTHQSALYWRSCM